MTKNKSNFKKKPAILFPYRQGTALSLILFIFLFFFVSCDDSKNDEIKKCSGDDCLTITEIGVTGTYANQMMFKDNNLYIVNSGDNSIQKIDLNNNSSLNPYISLPLDSNPYYFDIQNDEIYVSNLMTNSISRVKLNELNNVVNIKIEGEQSFLQPEGITANDDYIFVTNTNITYDENWNQVVQDGFLSIINKNDNTFNKKYTTSQKNSQRVFINNNKAYVINSGTIKFDDNYVSLPTSNASVDILNLSNPGYSFDKSLTFNYVDGTTKGNINNYCIMNNKLYLASGSAGEIYSINLETDEIINNTNNPIVTEEVTGLQNAMLNVECANNKIYAIDFNKDKLYIIDTNDENKVIYSSKITSGDLEGPLGITKDTTGENIYIFFGISKKIIKINVSKI